MDNEKLKEALENMSLEELSETLKTCLSAVYHKLRDEGFSYNMQFFGNLGDEPYDNNIIIVPTNYIPEGRTTYAEIFRA